MDVRHCARRANGFSLVEILVGLAIGLIGMIVMMQVFNVSESGKRNTTGGDDAQTAGAITLYALQRDIRQSGFGITNIKLMGCSVQLRAGIVLNSMAPVTINHASIPPGDLTTDTLLIVSGSGNGAQEGDTVTAQPAATMPRTYTVQTPSSFIVGDQVIVQPNTLTIPAVCNLTMEPVTALPAGTNNVTVATGVAAAANGYIYNMGQAPRILAYAIRNNVLTVCDYMVSDCGAAGSVANKAIWVPIANNMVSLRAQYARDALPALPPMDAVVDIYDQATPNTHCGWARVFAVRLALVARNSSYDKASDATTAAPTWAGSVGAPISIDDDADWQHYRYKLFQTTVPIRNVVATGAVPSFTPGGPSPC